MAKFELTKREPRRFAEIPERSTEMSAGYDFKSPVAFTLGQGQKFMVHTGIKVKLASDEVLLIYPRSSLGIKYDIILSNTVGIIDADYYDNEDNEGEIIIALVNEGNDIHGFNVGDKIAQGVITKFVKVEGDGAVGNTDGTDTEQPVKPKRKRKGGIGSTGK